MPSLYFILSRLVYESLSLNVAELFEGYLRQAFNCKRLLEERNSSV